VVSFGDDLGEIRADLTKLRQTLFNLLSNAAKFTENGTITLTATRERRQGADWITIQVSDTGIGIAEDKLPQVFEEFSQADGSTTRDYGGTGLGLSISQRFCRMMGGAISVASGLGEGSTFTVQLPATVDALEAAKAVAESEERGTDAIPEGVHPILVIDDDADSRDLLQRAFEADGFVVVTAASGEEGLDLARRLRPGFITLDVMMPGMDGWAVLKEVKADPALSQIPVAMISIVGEEDIGYSLGAVEHLIKPVDRDKLRELANLYARPSGGGHALVVDDDETIRTLFRRALEGDRWTVVEAENGAAALQRVSDKKPDLILLDLMMPIMDGFEFLVELRKVDDAAAIPVIVVTAKDLTEEDQRCLSGGVARIVQKGALTRQELLAQVRLLVARHCAPA
jgi:CheY-like chemotaxis protein